MSEQLEHQIRAEQRAFPDKKGGLNGWKLVFAAIVGGVVLTGFFFWRAHSQAAADAKLCLKVDTLDNALIQIVQSGGTGRLEPGQYGYAYQQAHPVETAHLLKSQLGQSGALARLRAAACNPKNLPTAKR